MGDHELPLALPNLDDPFAAARADIDARLAQFLKAVDDVWEKRDEFDEDLAARANDFITGAKQLAKEAEEARKAEKAPHLEAAKAVDASWEAIQTRIAKVIGLVAPPFELKLDAREVQYVFEVPLSFLLDPANHQRHQREFQGRTVHYYAIPYLQHYIWGATAGMLVNFHRRLAAGAA